LVVTTPKPPKTIHTVPKINPYKGFVHDHADRPDLRNDPFQNASIGFPFFSSKTFI
jgi:hypothetical protein